MGKDSGLELWVMSLLQRQMNSGAVHMMGEKHVGW